MSVKIFDTMTTATPNFPLAYAEKINVKLQDGTEDNLQNLFDNKELGGGGGDNSVTLTQQEYEALSEEQKLDGLYYTYDTKRIYKNGVQYGASDAEGIGYNNAESGIQATTVQGAIDKVVKTVEDNYAKKTEIPTTLPANGGNADTVNNHTVKSDVPENAVFTDTIYDDTEVNAKLNGKADKSYVDNNFATMDKFADYTKNIKIGKTEDVDANNLKSNANYIFPEDYTGNVSNMPSWVKRGGGLLECKSWGNYETQVFYPYGESIVYIRSLYYYDYKLHWSGWIELATMNKFEWKQLILPTPIVDGKTRTYDIDLSAYKEIAIQTWINDWQLNIDFRVVPLVESEIGYVVSYTNGTHYMTYRISYSKSRIKIYVEAENMALQNYPLLSLLLAR